MKKHSRWMMAGIALGAGAMGAVTAYRKRRNVHESRKANVWARPGMMVTFRAELMPGREREERTFRVKELLTSGRVSLHGVDGEHAQKEFESVQLDRPLA
jgi:hypothetical protein